MTEIVAPEQLPKILFLIQDPRVIEMATLQLEKMGYKICFARTTIEAFAQVQNFKPDVVLLSWNLKKVNIKSLYSHFTDKLKALVIVFSELNDPITIMKLNNSGIQNTLFPPLSGQGIHVRIQILLKKHKEMGAHVGKTDDIGFKPIAKESLPKNTQWKQVVSQVKDDNNVLLWKGVSAQSEDKAYFFESNLAPEHLFDSSSQLVHKGEDIALVETDKTGAQLMSQVHNEKRGDGGGHTGLDLFAEPELNVHLSLLHKLVREAAAKNLTLGPNSDNKIGEVKSVALLPIHTQRFKGYLVMAGAKGKLEDALCNTMVSELKKSLEENGEKLSETDTLCEIGFDSVKFHRWLERRRVDFSVVASTADSQEVIFAFLQREKYPLLINMDGYDFIGVKPQEVLAENSQLTFDLYLFLPKNNKFIKYVKKKKVVTPKVLQKLMEFQVNHIYFSKEEKKEFYEYLASTFLDFAL